jgi:ribonucleoside-diphosphate reductase beta chain
MTYEVEPQGSGTLMKQYIEHVADSIMTSLGYAKIYGAANPFSFMVNICLSGKSNFFERRPSEYQKACVLSKPEDNSFGLDEEF